MIYTLSTWRAAASYRQSYATLGLEGETLTKAALGLDLRRQKRQNLAGRRSESAVVPRHAVLWARTRYTQGTFPAM